MNQQPWTTESFTSCLHIKDRSFDRCLAKFLRRTNVEFNGIICIQFANLQNRWISEKLLQLFLPWPHSNVSNKTYRSTGSKEIQKLGIKAMNTPELSFPSIPSFETPCRTYVSRSKFIRVVITLCMKLSWFCHTNRGQLFCNCPLFVIALVPGLFLGGKPDETCCHSVVASKWLETRVSHFALQEENATT